MQRDRKVTISNYCRHCIQRFGRVLPHRLRTLLPVQLARTVEQTSKAWRQRYPDEPFQLPISEWTSLPSDAERMEHGHLADLLTGVARREIDFTYQIALPHVRDANFLYAAVERYRKLLLLRRLRAAEVAASWAFPTDILLMTRVHALHPTQYGGDIRRLLGDSTTGAGEIIVVVECETL